MSNSVGTIYIVTGSHSDYECSYSWSVVAHCGEQEAQTDAASLEVIARLLDGEWERYRKMVNTVHKDLWDVAKYRALRTDAERQVVLEKRAEVLKDQTVEEDRLRKQHPDPNYRVGAEIEYTVEPLELR